MLYWYLRLRERNTAALLTANSVDNIEPSGFHPTHNTDILSTSPVFVPHSRWPEPILGLTFQNSKEQRLEVCGFDNRLKCASIAPTHDVRSDTLYTQDGSNKPAIDFPYRFFQSTPIVTDHSMIVLKRGVDDSGARYSDFADAFVIDLAKLGEANTASDIVTEVIPGLPIRERDEPIVALPDGAKPPVIISLVAEDKGGGASLYELDIASGSERKPAVLTMSGKPLNIAKSWLGRPVLLMRPATKDAATTPPTTSRLVFSRTTFTTTDKNVDNDQVNLDFLVLGRSGRDWRAELGARCKVIYTHRAKDLGSQPCALGGLDQNGKRVVEASTAVTLLMGTQLLAGYSTQGALTLALRDQCVPDDPIVLDAKLDVEKPLLVGNLETRHSEASVGRPHPFKRTVTCENGPDDLTDQSGMRQ